MTAIKLQTPDQTISDERRCIRMGVKIHIEPDKTWSFFKANPKRMNDEMVAVAENDETEYAVYLTDDGFRHPLFVVCKGDKQIYEEDATSAADCADTAKRLYAQHLFPVTQSKSGLHPIGNEDMWEAMHSADDIEPTEQEDTIYEREDELILALSDFLQVALCCPEDVELDDMYGSNIVTQILDGFCEYLSNEHCISIYRPTFLQGENGEDIYTEYPYGGEFDDGEEDMINA
jgi:hypothetical protein